MMKIFSIFDSKTGAYHQPFFSPTVSAALRSCEDAVKDQDALWGKHSEDFVLFELGEFDEFTGLINPEPAAKAITKFNDLAPLAPAEHPALSEVG